MRERGSAVRSSPITDSWTTPRRPASESKARRPDVLLSPCPDFRCPVALRRPSSVPVRWRRTGEHRGGRLG
eukprot:7477388-Alexandrium_andersonii.AAC.1